MKRFTDFLLDTGLLMGIILIIYLIIAYIVKVTE